MSSQPTPQEHHPDPQSLTIFGLNLYCQEELNRFFDKQSSQAPYSYELLRRALSQPPAEDQELAWQYVQQQFTFIVVGQINRSGLSNLGPQERDTIIHDSFLNFWLRFHHQKVTFKNFPTVATLMSYLSYQALDVLKKVRQESLLESLPTAISSNKTFSISKLSLQEAWQCIAPWLTNEQEKIVAYYRFIEGLKPSDIWQLYRDSGLFAGAKEISRIRERLVKRMATHESGIRDCLAGN